MHRVFRTGVALALLSLTACSSEPPPGNRLGCVGAACDPAGGAGGTSSGPTVRGPAGSPGTAGQAGQGGTAGRGGSPSGTSGHATAGQTGQAGEPGTSGQAGTSSSGASGSAPVAGAAGAAPVNPYAGETCTEGRVCSETAPCAAGETCEAGLCTGHQSPSCGPVVHEWGTYTSVVASDGHALGGVHHVDEPLPSWVFRRSSKFEKGYEVLPEEPRQQLETPVLYFHTDRVMKVDVDVSFPQGVVGEWFPDCTGFLPEFEQMKAIAGGRTTWQLRLDPSIDPSTYPPVTPDEIWAPSRHVDSTPVSTFPDPLGQEQHEQFLFYRGLATFAPALTIRADADGTVRIHSAAAEAIGSVFVLRATATEGSFVSLGSLAAGGDLVSPVPATSVPRDAFVEAARTGLHTALVASGLHADEALAMVDTWTRSWFGGQGTRVLYIAPRSWTDAWLPTTVLPTPSDFVRTLVGRVEVLTPPEEAALAHEIELINSTQSVQPSDLSSRFDRFAESRLERAAELLVGQPAWHVADDLRQKSHEGSYSF